MAAAQPELAQLSELVDRKMEQTQAWVAETYGNDCAALFLMDAKAWQHFPPAVQKLGGWAMKRVLAATYPPDGEGYPLPEYIGEEHNAQSIASGAMLPYFGFVAPRSLTAKMVYDNPELLLECQQRLQLIPLAVSARMVSRDGSVELGRSARVAAGFGPGFRGGALILQSYIDWLSQETDNPSHVVRAEVRAADAHLAADGELIPSSAATQEEHFGRQRMGLLPTLFLPGYVVGERLEPFVVGELYRSDTWREHLRDFTVHTPGGEHLAFLEALCQYQTGESLPLTVGASTEATGYQYCNQPQVHGGTVYAKIEVVANTDGKGKQPLLQTVRELDEVAPLVMVRIPADSPEGAATQALLMQHGFIVCGLELAHDVPDEQGDCTRLVPPTVYMARLGASVRSGHIPLARALFPPNLYGESLQQEFARVDQAFRNSVGHALQPS